MGGGWMSGNLPGIGVDMIVRGGWLRVSRLFFFPFLLCFEELLPMFFFGREHCKNMVYISVPT